MRSWLAIGAMLGVLSFGEPAGAVAKTERELESLLLNRTVPLDHVLQYSRSQKTWQSLRASSARVRVVNLWSRTCTPCLEELPSFREEAAAWKQRSPRDVEFLFVEDRSEDPKESGDALPAFWASPFADVLADKCPGVKMQRQGKASCLLDVPDTDPARSTADDILLALDAVATRPLTLLLDRDGTVRQVFAGPITGKRPQLTLAIERLLHVTKPGVATSSRRTASR